MSRRLGAIALLALLVRAVTPAGFMLAAADAPTGRYLTVTFCEDHSRPAQVIDLDTGKPVDPSTQSTGESNNSSPDNSSLCVFAGATSLAAPIQASEAVEFIAVEREVVDARETMQPGRGIAAPPPPSTGPPSLI